MIVFRRHVIRYVELDFATMHYDKGINYHALFHWIATKINFEQVSNSMFDEKCRKVIVQNISYRDINVG